MGLALLRRNRPRLSDEGRIEASGLDTPVPQRRLETFASRRRPGFVAAVPVHGVGAGLIQQLVDDNFSRSAAQHQRVASLAQAVIQRAERSVKPPAPGTARSPFAGVEIIKNENRNYRAAAAIAAARARLSVSRKSRLNQSRVSMEGNLPRRVEGQCY